MLFQALFTNLGRLGDLGDLFDPFYPLLVKIGLFGEKMSFPKIIKYIEGDFHVTGEDIECWPFCPTKGGGANGPYVPRCCV